MHSYSQQRNLAVVICLLLCLVVLCIFSLSTGAIETGIIDTLKAILGVLGVAEVNPEYAQLPLIIGQIRMPRLVLGILAGSGLAMAGAVMQALFRNPMADPGLLGVSSGAALGAVFAIVIGGTVMSGVLSTFGNGLQIILAFGGSLASLILVYSLARTDGRTDIPTMLLAGVAVNAITGALIGLMSYVASDTELRNLIFWSLGSLEVTQWWKIGVTAIIVVPCCCMLLVYSMALNANLLGENEARHLGFDIEKIKRRLILLVALIVSVIVAMSGIIGFVGLVVPHLLRLMLGPDHRLLLPASALFGALLLVAADLVARILIAPAELPIGIITAVLGGPFFLMLLIRQKHRRPF